jgi:hypothetical protein
MPNSQSCVVPVIDYEPMAARRSGGLAADADRAAIPSAKAHPAAITPAEAHSAGASTNPAPAPGPRKRVPPNQPIQSSGATQSFDAKEFHSAGQVRIATAFADATLRRVLEVIDRRRPLSQLRPLLASGLLDSLLQGANRGAATGAAQLRRVRVQLIGPKGAAAEVAATYARGGRIHAIACRMEQTRTVSGSRWQLIALHLG